MMEHLLAAAEQLVSAAQAGGAQARELAQGLLAGARQLVESSDAIHLAEHSMLSLPGGSLTLGPATLRLVRPGGAWNSLGLAFRPGGGCLLDLDGQSFWLGSQVLDEAAQEQRFLETVSKVERGFSQTPPAFAPTFSPGADWQLEARNLLGSLKVLVQKDPDGIHVEPLERDWLCADGSDELQIVAYLSGDLSDLERRESLELQVQGPLNLSPAQDGEFYRYWSVRSSTLLAPAVGELWLSGQIQGRRMQRQLCLQLLPPLQITPAPAILVPKHRQRLTVQLRTWPQSEDWSLQVSHPSLLVKQTGAELFELQLGAEPVGLLAPLHISARRNGTSFQREVPVLVAQPGPVVLSASPLCLRADGHHGQELGVSLWGWNENRQELEVVEDSLSSLRFSVAFTPDLSAELDFQFLRIQGAGLARQAIYRVSCARPPAGSGSLHGKVIISAPQGACSLPLVLSLGPL